MRLNAGCCAAIIVGLTNAKNEYAQSLGTGACEPFLTTSRTQRNKLGWLHSSRALHTVYLSILEADSGRTDISVCRQMVH